MKAGEYLTHPNRCPRCGRHQKGIRYTLCDPRWMREVGPRLTRVAMAQERYVGRVEAELAYPRSAS